MMYMAEIQELYKTWLQTILHSKLAKQKCATLRTDIWAMTTSIFRC